MDTIAAMRRYAKRNKSELRAAFAQLTGTQPDDNWSKDTLIKELAMRAAHPAPEDSPTESEAPGASAPEPETTYEPDPGAPDVPAADPQDQQPTDAQEANEAATEDTMSTKTSKRGGRTKAHRPPKPKAERKPRAPRERKPRAKPAGIPGPGESFVRRYKGRDLTIKVTDSGYRWDGADYPSLTSLAMAITGAKAISGPAFFGVWKPKAE